MNKSWSSVSGTIVINVNLSYEAGFGSFTLQLCSSSLILYCLSIELCLSRSPNGKCLYK